MVYSQSVFQRKNVCTCSPVGVLNSQFLWLIFFLEEFKKFSHEFIRLRFLQSLQRRRVRIHIQATYVFAFGCEK